MAIRSLWGASKDTRIASRYIPNGSTAVERPGGVVYTYEVERAGAKAYLAIAYRGTAGKSEWHYSYKTEAQRTAKVDEFFAGIARHAEYKKQVRAERKHEGAETGDYSLAETAELVKGTLRKVFPGTKFSARSKSYSGGSSISVGWVDGPTAEQVRPILESFEGADFDGMQDLKTYKQGYEWNGRRVRFHVDFVHGQRRVSKLTMQAASKLVARHCDLPVLEVEGDEEYPRVVGGGGVVPYGFRDGKFYGDSHRGEVHQQLVYQVAHGVSLEAAVGGVDLPREVTPGYVDEVVRGMVEGVSA